MIRLSILLFFISLALGSCGNPASDPTIQSSPSHTIISATDRPTDTPFATITLESPTATQTITGSETPTATLTPSITQQHAPDFYLPPLTAGEVLTITQIKMTDQLNGWGIGHQIKSGDRIIYTQDGGESWDERTPPIQSTSKYEGDMIRTWGYFLDEQTAWAISLPQQDPPPIDALVIWRTINGGQSWEASEPLPLTGDESFFTPENFSFIDPLQGWLLVHIDAGMSHDYSNLYSTADGGKSWIRIIDPYQDGLQSLHNTGLAFANSNYGWVTKDNLAVMPGAFIEQTLDGGLSWEDNFLPEPDEFDWFEDISQCATSHPTFSSEDRGVVLVNCHTFDQQYYTYIYISEDEGQSWQFTKLPSPVQSLQILDQNFGWAFGRILYKSTDGGLSWVKIKSVSWDGQFSFVDPRNGWAVATSDDAIAFVHTQDGGITWQIIKPTLR